MPRKDGEKSAEFMLIEDDPDDVMLIQEAFKGCRFSHSFRVFHKGDEAVTFLLEKAALGVGRPADLILLDLNLPGMDGREVLAKIKTNSKTKCIPVIVLTTSDSSRDIRLAYEAHANSYITKPTGLSQFVTIAKRIEDYWLDTVELPRP